MKIDFQKVLWIVGGIAFIIAAVIYFRKGSSLAWANVVAAILSFLNAFLPNKKEKSRK